MLREKMYRTPIFLFLQFLISFLAVCLVDEALTARYGAFYGMVSGCAVGLLLTANLLQSVLALQVVLDRLAQGLPVELVALYRYWPLQTLFQLVGGMERQRGQQVQIEQQTVAYKDQLMEQVIATTAQEERNRLARDLHDSIKQQIFSITMSAAAAKARWEHDKLRVRGILDDIERTAREAQVEMQAMLQQLRPHALENTGLVESLRMQSQALEYRTGATVTVEIGHLPPEDQLSPGAQEVIFRIVQEGFANIARHARASQVWLSLYQQEKFLLLEIGDDGQGFDLEHIPDRSNAGGMGMQNIRERMQALHGTVQLWSQVEQGTTLQIAFPLLPQTEAVLEAEQREPALTTTMKRARKIQWLGLRMIDVGAACILLSAPGVVSLPLLTLCLLGAGITWIIAHPLRTQVAISMGRKHVQLRALVLKGDQLLLGLLLLGTFDTVFFRYDFLMRWPVTLLIACFLLLAGRYYVKHFLHLRLLSMTELREYLHAQQQQLGLDLLAWSIVVGCEAFFGIITPDLHVFSESQFTWEQNAAGIMSLLWLAANVLKGLETLYWHLILVRRKV